jgi:addiction module RelE/StbE family toxin
MTYISERNRDAAERLQAAIEACAERLPDHPFVHRTGKVPGTREAVVHPNYLLIYEVHRDAVEIMRVVHSRQKYPPGEGLD